MILDNEDILIQKAEETVNIPTIVYNMFNDKLSYNDRCKYATMVFEYIKSYCNLPDLISYKVSNNLYFVSLCAKGTDTRLIEISKQNKRLVISFYTDYKPILIEQLKYYGLTIAQYDQIKSKLIELFNLEECYDISEISEISFHWNKYISKYDIR